MARGLPMLMLTTAMADMEDMAATVMARGLPMLMLTTAMADMEVMAAMAMARGLLMPTMAATDMAATVTARGLLMPTTVAMDMAATATASNFKNTKDLTPQQISIPDLNLFTNCYHELNHLKIQYSVE